MTRPDGRAVVWVSPELPAQPRSGAALRSHRLIQSLAGRTAVRIVVVGGDVAERAELQLATGAASVDYFPRPALTLSKALTALTRALPTGSAAAWSGAAHARIQKLAETGAVVVVDHLQMAPYLPSGHILSLHNVEAALLDQLPARSAALSDRALLRWDRATTRRLERRALISAGRVICVSDSDAAQLAGSVTVVPNGTDLPHNPPAPPDCGDLLFIAAWKYAPNREAVEWWTQHVWRPGLPPLVLVGSGAEFLGESTTQHPGVVVRGEVTEVAPQLSAAAVVAVPLKSGGGTRLKVLEALAWARPVVSTSKGVEGLPVQPGQHLVIEDDPLRFGDAVLSLLKNRTEAIAMGLRGRELARHFDWDSLTPGFIDTVLNHPL